MIAKYLFSIAVLNFTIFSAQSQVLKVKRKGVTPIDVTKPAQNQSTFTIGQFTGKWQEMSRTDSRNNPVPFKDTLFYNFSDKGEVFSRDGVNMSLMGEAAIDPGNVLIAAADVFTIKSMNKDGVILDDGEYVHRLVRKNNFWYETLPTNYVAPERFTDPITVNISALVGKWKVYRRDARPGYENKRILIRILNVIQPMDNNTATGELTFYQKEKFETLPCTLNLSMGKMHITTAQDSWTVNVYKADGKDLVFGEPSLMYYCKPL